MTIRSGLGHLVFGAAFLVACGNSPTTPGTLLPQDARAEQFRTALDTWAAGAGHYGVSASVILSDGTQWSGVAGLSGAGQPLRLEHLIAIASITKTMTGAMILQLADESRLSLDDPISRWLPPREHINPAITIRQLLNHTNGLANYTLNSSLGQAISESPTKVFTAEELLTFVGPPSFAPGATTEYTNTSFILLGLIAEKASGQSYRDLLHHRVLTPQGVTEVFLPGFEGAPGPVAIAQTSFGLGAPTDQMARLSVGNSAFGLMASARHIATWGHRLFTGSVVSSRMQQEMRTMVSAAGNISGESGAGLGIRGYSYLGRSQIGHSGGSSFGSSLLLHDVATRVTVVVLMNQAQGADHFTLAPTLLDLATR
jgi:D-alanyl-D-alanine carboxypeptidase